jgi:predicted nucleic acid-binding OB-fold protein
MKNEFELPADELHPFIQDEINKMEKDANEYGVVMEDFERRARFGMLYARVKSRYDAMDLERKVVRGKIILEIEGLFRKAQPKLTATVKEAMAMRHPKYISFLEKIERATLCCHQLQTLIKRLDQKMEFDKSEQISQIAEKKHSQGEGRY